MSKKVINLIFILVLLVGASKVEARTFSADEVKNIITKKVLSDYKKYTKAELEARVVALPFNSLNLPDGKVDFVLKEGIDKFQPRSLQSVTVKVDGKIVKVFNAPVVVKAFQNVLVASDFLPANKVLNSTCVEAKKIEVSNKMQYTLSADVLRKEIITKKPFKSGEVIDKRFVKLKPDVQRNAQVMAYFTNDKIMITVYATALSDGMLGDYIGLENKDYKRVYTGKVIGENKVLIEI